MTSAIHRKSNIVSILNLSGLGVENRFKMSANQVLRNWKAGFQTHNLPKSLLSRVTFENVVFALRWGCFWGGVPYEYDNTRHRIITTKKSVRLWTIATVIQAINFAYFCGAMMFTLALEEEDIDRNGRNKNSMFDIAFGFLITLIHGGLLVVVIHVGAFRRNEFRYFVNSTIKYCIFAKGKYANQFGARWRNGCEELMAAARVTLIILPFLAAIHFLQHPEKAIYVTSVLPRNSIFYGVAYISYSLLRLSLVMGGWATVMSIFFPMIGCVFCFLSLLEEIKPGRKVYRTIPSFRKPEDLRLTIKSVQFIAIQINEIIKQILMAQQTLISYTTMVCVVSLIRFWAQLTLSTKGVLILTVVCIVGIWTTILTLAAETYAGAEKGLNSWRNFNNWSPVEKKLMKKYRKSIRPIQLEFGGFYYIRPKKILGFFNTLVWLVVRGLLTLPDNHHHH